MRRPRLQPLLVWTLACWQVLLLVICVPAASAGPAPELAAHACCADAPASRPEEPLTCPHCSDGNGRFVDAASPVLLLAPDALVERVDVRALTADSLATLADERPVYRPPDPSLFALRCALIR